MTTPRAIDNDKYEITVMFDGTALRSWLYFNDTERRIKMLCARTYIEGWCDGRNEDELLNSLQRDLK
jgi:dTDP-D-glucose 4,6-dehydratase